MLRQYSTGPWLLKIGDSNSFKLSSGLSVNVDEVEDAFLLRRVNAQTLFLYRKCYYNTAVKDVKGPTLQKFQSKLQEIVSMKTKNFIKRKIRYTTSWRCFTGRDRDCDTTGAKNDDFRFKK